VSARIGAANAGAAATPEATSPSANHDHPRPRTSSNRNVRHVPAKILRAATGASSSGSGASAVGVPSLEATFGSQRVSPGVARSAGSRISSPTTKVRCGPGGICASDHAEALSYVGSPITLAWPAARSLGDPRNTRTSLTRSGGTVARATLAVCVNRNNASSGSCEFAT